MPLDVTQTQLTLTELYEFYFTVNTTNDTTAFFTSYSEDIVVPDGGNNYMAIPIKRSNIAYNMNLQVDKVTITLGLIGVTIGTIPYTIPEIIRRGYLRSGKVKVYLADYIEKDTKTLLFEGFTTGEIGWNQGTLTIECMSILDKVNDMFPKKLYSEFCQHRLYDDYCWAGRLDTKDDWIISGTVSPYADFAKDGVKFGDSATAT